MSLEYNFIYDIVLIAQITHKFTVLKLCELRFCTRLKRPRPNPKDFTETKHHRMYQTETLRKQIYRVNIFLIKHPMLMYHPFLRFCLWILSACYCSVGTHIFLCSNLPAVVRGNSHSILDSWIPNKSQLVLDYLLQCCFLIILVGFLCWYINITWSFVCQPHRQCWLIPFALLTHFNDSSFCSFHWDIETPISLVKTAS